MTQAAAVEVMRAPWGLTLEAWAEMDDEPGELVDGRLVEEEVPSVLHEAAVIWLIYVLEAWARTRGAWVFGSEFKLGMHALRRGRKPDAVMFLPGNPPPSKTRSMATHPPSVVVEVISPRARDARRDQVEKLNEYAKFGVLFYWLVNPKLRTLQILELGENRRYAIALSAADGVHAVPGCEGFMLDLDALWTRLDALPDDGEGEEEKA